MSRTDSSSRAGEILASADLLAGCDRVVPVAGERTLELKGIAEPLTAVLVAWNEAGEVEPSTP